MINTALLVVDVQKYYINEHTKELPEKIVSHIKNNSYDFVLFSQFINHRETNMYKTFQWGKMMTPEHTDLYPGLLKFVKEGNLFKKDTYSVFKAKGFKEFLEKNQVTNLYICGLDTDACILATAYDGFDLGYAIHVLNDLTDSHAGEEFREHGLKIINKNLQTND